MQQIALSCSTSSTVRGEVALIIYSTVIDTCVCLTSLWCLGGGSSPLR